MYRTVCASCVPETHVPQQLHALQCIVQHMRDATLQVWASQCCNAAMSTGVLCPHRRDCELGHSPGKAGMNTKKTQQRLCQNNVLDFHLDVLQLAVTGG